MTRIPQKRFKRLKAIRLFEQKVDDYPPFFSPFEWLSIPAEATEGHTGMVEDQAQLADMNGVYFPRAVFHTRESGLGRLDRPAPLHKRPGR